MTTAKQTQHYTNWLEKECERILKWAGYVPHTIFHRYRYPVIGSYNAWERLEDHLDFQRRGQLPNNENDEDNQHVLDVIIYSNQDRNSFILPKTDMHTIVIWHPSSYKMKDSDMQQWTDKLGLSNGSIACIDLDHTTDDSPIDLNPKTQPINEYNNIDILMLADTSEPSSTKKPSNAELKCVDLFKDSKDDQGKPKGKDLIGTILKTGSLSNIISSYQEHCIRKIMEECGALIYNKNLLSGDPPDGYYLCDAKCLDKLRRYFQNATYIFETENIFNPPAKGTSVLLTVEVKASMDCLLDKLVKKKDYYIFTTTPKAIRVLTVVDGGIKSRTWLFLINLASFSSTNRITTINEDAYKVCLEFARTFKIASTHVVHLPHFSTEIFRQEPLTKARLEFLRCVYQTDQYLKARANTARKIRRANEIIFNLFNVFIAKNSPGQMQSRINEKILFQTTTNDKDKFFTFLEQLAVSLGKEKYRTTKQLNYKSNIYMPQWITDLAKELEQKKSKKVLNKQEQQPNLVVDTNEIQPEISTIQSDPVKTSCNDDEISSLILE